MSNNGGPTATTTQQIGVPPLPPTYLRGCQKPCKCEPKIAINIPRWQPPTQGGTPVSYEIYRDASLNHLVGIVPGTQRRFSECACLNTQYKYYVVSVSAAGINQRPLSF